MKYGGRERALTPFKGACSIDENHMEVTKMASGKHLMAIIAVMVLVTAGVLGAVVLMEPSNEDTSITASFDSPSDGSTVTRHDQHHGEHHQQERDIPTLS